MNRNEDIRIVMDGHVVQGVNYNGRNRAMLAASVLARIKQFFPDLALSGMGVIGTGVSKLILAHDGAVDVDDDELDGDYPCDIVGVEPDVVVSPRVNGVIQRARIKTGFPYPAKQHVCRLLLNDELVRQLIPNGYQRSASAGVETALFCWDVAVNGGVISGRCHTPYGRSLGNDKDGRFHVELGPLAGVDAGEWVTLLAVGCGFRLGVLKLHPPLAQDKAVSLTIPTAWLKHVQADVSAAGPVHMFFKTGHVPSLQRMGLGGTTVGGALLSMSEVEQNQLGTVGMTCGTPLYEVETESGAFHVLHATNVVDMHVGLVGITSAFGVSFCCVFPGVQSRARVLIAHRTVQNQGDYVAYHSALPLVLAAGEVKTHSAAVANAIALDSPAPLVTGVSGSVMPVTSRGNFWPIIGAGYGSQVLQYGRFPFSKHSTGKWPLSTFASVPVFLAEQVPYATRQLMYELAGACATAGVVGGDTLRSTRLFKRVLCEVALRDDVLSSRHAVADVCQHKFVDFVDECGRIGKLCEMCVCTPDGLLMRGQFV